MPFATVWPALPTVQVCEAVLGAETPEAVVQLFNESAAGLFTTRLNPTDAAEPALGVAVNVPV